MGGNLVASNKLTDEKTIVETELTMQELAESPKIATGSIENLSEVDADKKKKKKLKKKKKKKKGIVVEKAQSMDQNKTDSTMEHNKTDLTLDQNNRDLDMQALAESPNMAAVPTENLSEVNADNRKRKKRRKKKKKGTVNDEVQSMDQNKTGSTENPAEENVNTKRKRKRIRKKAKNRKEIQTVDQEDSMSKLHIADGREIDGKLNENIFTDQETELSVRKEPSLSESMHDKENPLSLCKDEDDTVNDKVQSMDQKNTGSTESPAGGNVNIKRKRKRIKRKAKKKKETETVDQEDGMLKLHLADEREIDGKLTENDCAAQETELSVRKEPLHDKENPSSLCKDEDVVLLPDVVENIISLELNEESAGLLGHMEVEEKFPASESQHNPHTDQITGQTAKLENGSNNGIVDMESECLSKGLGKYREIVPIASSKRKLLVLDVNGLLADIVMPAPKDCRADTHILRRAIFRRPFCDDFLKFCFQNFDVGIWSSRSKRIIDRVVDYLLGDLQGQLLFCWDMFHSTQTGFKTLENTHKPLVCKELRRIWENDDPNLPWKKGDYNESNTLLLDDSPYKALLNPLHTAIFPNSYHYDDKNDNSLGPGGDLRVYLEGLLTCENVQKYVEQNPFGQSAINETNSSWGFYSGVLQTISNQIEEDNTPSPLPTLS